MSTYDEDRSIYNGDFELEILIARPVSQVWIQYVDTSTWVLSHLIENLQGDPGTVGSITRVTYAKAEEEGYTAPHYHFCKVIKSIPEKQYVLKTYSEKGGSYGIDMTCFDDTRFHEIGGKTKVTFNIYVEIRGDSVASDPAAMNLDSSRDGMWKNLTNLKTLLESR